MLKNLMLAMLCLRILVLSYSAWAENAEQKAVIGLAGPITGPRAVYGEQMRQGAEIAAKDLNASGGLLGKQIVLDVEDDSNDAKQAVAVANKLVSRGVQYVVGHWGAGMTMPASDVYAENNVLEITPASIMSSITTKGHKLVFRTVGTDKQLADRIGTYLEKKYKPTDKILILSDDSAPAAQSTTNFLEEDLKKGGFSNIVREYFKAGDKDFSALITKTKQIQPAVIFCGCYNIEGGLIIRTARDAGVTQPFVGWDVFNTPELWEITGKAGEGTVFISDPPFENNPSAKSLVAALEAEKIQPQTYHFYTYASFQVIQQAVEMAHSLDPIKVAEAIRQGHFHTAIGEITYSPNGDLKESKYEVYVHKDNKTLPVTE